MKQFRRIISLILALCLLLPMLPQPVSAAEETQIQETTIPEEMVEITEGTTIPVETTVETSLPEEMAAVEENSMTEAQLDASGEAVGQSDVRYYGTCGANLSWEHYWDGTLIISGTGEMDDSWGTQYGPPWKNKTTIKSVIIEEGVTSIGSYAFSHCENLTSVSIPDSVELIRTESFAYCVSLAEIDLPNGVRIGTSAFEGCSALTSLEIPEDCWIGMEAFSWCDGLISVIIPGTATIVGYASVKGQQFFACPNLSEVTIGEGITLLPERLFSNCVNLKVIKLPATLTSIGDAVFEGCTSLSTVNYGGTPDQWDTLVSSMGYGNEYLLYAKPGSLEGVSGSCGKHLIWEFVEATGTLSISGTGAMYDYTRASDAPWYEYRNSISSVEIEYGATYISSNAFSDYVNLSSVEIPSSVASIGEYAFSGCRKLTEVQLPADVILRDSAFSRCFGLISLELPVGCTIEDAVFTSCTALQSVTIPSEVYGIGSKVFSSCSELTSITIQEGITEIPEGMFEECESLEEIILPESVTRIGENAFRKCENLTNITIPYSHNVTTILDNAFYECYRIQNIYYGGTQAHWENYVKHVGKNNEYFTNAIIHFTDEDRLVILSDHLDRSINVGGNITLGAGVIYGAKRMTDLSGLTFWIDDPNVFSVVKQEIQGDYLYLTLCGLKEGSATVSFTDSKTGFSSQVYVTAYENNAHSYTLGGVPIVYSGKYDTNFYNFSGLYIDSFAYEYQEASKSTAISFEVYNRKYTYAVVEIYNADGDPIDVAIIEKNKMDNTSIKECLWDGPVGLIKEAKDIISMRPVAESVHTPIRVTVPENGYIKICTDPEESLIVAVINLVDLLFSIKEIVGDLGDTLDGIKEYSKNRGEFVRVLSKAMLEEKFRDELVGDENKLAKKVMKNISKEVFFSAEALGDFAQTIAKNLDEANLTGIIAKTAMGFGIGVGESMLLFSLDYIGLIMGGLFTIGKIQNALCQAINLRQAMGDGAIYIQNQGGGSRHAKEISVESENGFDDDVALNVFRVESYQNSKALESLQKHYPQIYNSVQKDGYSYTYNISLLKRGKEVQPEGEVTVYIPTPDTALIKYAAMNQVKIFREEEDGTLTEIDFMVENDCFVFTTDHFSLYTISAFEELGIIRLSGKDRCLTAQKAADAMKSELGVENFDAVIYASGTNFADALAGSYLSAVKNAPILLHTASAANLESNVEYIKNNLAPGGKVYILGGTAAVPEAAETAFQEAGIRFERVKGKTRYQTNLEILKAGGFSGGKMLVCTAENFADSLSASATGLPILLVSKTWTDLSAEQKTYLSDKGSCEFVIIGGTGAVKAEMEEALKNFGTVKRIKGKTRYETSIEVAKEFFPAPTSAVLAYAENYPDGLCGGALAYAKNAPLILTKTGSITAAKGYVSGMGITSGAVLGGTKLIDDASVREIFGLAADAEIVK